jgi:signal transduction histidine kinase
LISVPPSPDFYTQLSNLFRQMADSPGVLPDVPLDRWPAGSAERSLLEEFQAALHASGQDRQAQTEKSEQQHHTLHQWMEDRMREQATLLEISQMLAAELELKPELILDQLREIVDYTHATLFALNDMELVAQAVCGPPHLKQAMPLRIRLAGPEILATLLNGHQPTRIGDVQKDDPSAQFLRTLLAQHTNVLLAGMHAWIWVPLAVKGRVIGAMSIAHAEADAFTAHHADLALTLANQAAITMVNAHLHTQAQTLATLEERQRLARNLHDAGNQSLFPAGLIADVLPRLWEQDPVEGRESLADLRRLIRGAQAELRGLLAELRPNVLIDTKLQVLLRQLGDALTSRTNIPVAVNVTGDGVLPADVQTMFYRVGQEALSNVDKHAEAGQVVIHLQFEPGTTELRIYDDGQGFDSASVPSGHHGLSIMSERAEAIGAALSITSRPGHGTEITVRWREAPPQEEL